MCSHFIAILFEKRLHGLTEVREDAEGNITIIQDASVPEDLQQYVHLSPVKVRALVNFLTDKEVAEVYRQQH